MNRKSLLNGLLWNLLVAFDFRVASAFDCPGSKTPPLIVKEKRFYVSTTNEYFPIKGIAYYPRPNDGPLSKSNSVDFYTDEFSDRWTEDIANLKDLGVNAIRLYAVDPSKNHDNFMCALQEAGIYVMLGLLADCEDCGIGAWVGRNAEPPLCYTSTVKDRGKFVIRSFSRYDNLMAFSAGNEVSIYADDGVGGPREANVPCQKKFLRDMREYVAGCANGVENAVLPRKVPIGVVNWDGNFQSFEQHVYYHCRTDPNDQFENTEWFALNSYRHCDGFATSKDDIIGWPELKTEFLAANFPGPVLFGEYGCRERGFPTMDGFETQRTWFQAEALYTPEYSDVFAGGFVFEYSAEKDVVDINLQFMADRFNNGVPTSEWPYQKFAKINYGVGYFSPIDCQHDDGSGDNSNTPCEYIKYPEWDGLVETLAGAEGQSIKSQSPGSIPPCPGRFQALSFYQWPTDDEEDLDLDYCLELKRIEDIKTDAPTANPTENEKTTVVTDAPTPSPSESIATPKPTLAPTMVPSVSPSFVPTILTRQDISTISPTLPPTLSSDLSPTTPINVITTSSPTSSPTVSPTKTPTVSPSTKPSVKPTLLPTQPPSVSPTKSPNVTPTATPTSTPTLPNTVTPSSAEPTSSLPSLSPTALITEAQSAQCSFHPRCSELDLAGVCCPTLEGVFLGCCDILEKDEAEASAAETPFARGVGFLLAVSALLVNLLL